MLWHLKLSSYLLLLDAGNFTFPSFCSFSRSNVWLMHPCTGVLLSDTLQGLVCSPGQMLFPPSVKHCRLTSYYRNLLLFDRPIRELKMWLYGMGSCTVKGLLLFYVWSIGTPPDSICQNVKKKKSLLKREYIFSLKRKMASSIRQQSDMCSTQHCILIHKNMQCLVYLHFGSWCTVEKQINTKVEKDTLKINFYFSGFFLV